MVLSFTLTTEWSVGANRNLPANYARFFCALGLRVREQRTMRKLSQTDMVSYGFSLRHWQMIEAGGPITMTTLLRVCEAFAISPEQVLAGLGKHVRRRNRT